MESNKDLISVIIPVYNVAPYLEKSIGSILNQTYENLEIIIIEDCSTDNSFEILKSFKDKRIKLIQNKKNKGVGYNGNLGLSLANGKYIARHDSDDISAPKRLETQYNYLKLHPETIAVGALYNAIFSDGTIERRYNHENNLMTMIDCPIHQPVAMFRADFVYKHRIKYGHLPEDYPFWNRIFEANNYAPKTFYNINEILLDYTIRENQLTSLKRRDFIKYKKKWQIKYLENYLNSNGANVKFPHKIDTNFIKNLNKIWFFLQKKEPYTQEEFNQFWKSNMWCLLYEFNPHRDIIKAFYLYNQHKLYGNKGFFSLIKRYMLKKRGDFITLGK